MTILLDVAVLFLIVTFGAYLLGVKGVAGLSMEVAKVLIVMFVILFAATFIAGVWG
jgi:uncharacterized membrane protein YtjA (UPF0391 family)